MEDYRKIHEESLKVMQQLVKSGDIKECYAMKVFPELAESENEKIRKELLEHCKNQAKPYIQTGNKCSQIQSWIDWLEKQGKHKSDPRYSILDKLIEADDIYQMSVNDAMVEEAKNKAIEVLSKLEISKLLWPEKQGKQKPTWSEEDENRVNRLIAYFEDKESFTAEDDIVYANWLKSLKDKVLPQSNQEWNEEDKKMFVNIKACLRNANEDYGREVDWLKSLRPQNRWKPSDEQMEVLDKVIKNPYLSTSEYNGLIALREQLKALYMI